MRQAPAAVGPFASTSSVPGLFFQTFSWFASCTQRGMATTSDGARRQAATSVLLVLTWCGVLACGSSNSPAPSDDSGGSAVAGTASSGGSTSEGGTSTGASGGAAAAGGGSDAGRSGAASGGKSDGGASGSAGPSGSGGTSGRGCPASAPAEGGLCPPALLGMPCFYDDCGGSGVRKKATCITAIPEIGNPIQQWTVTTSACEPIDCLAMACQTGQVCVILEGGARFGQCAPQSCGTGPIECDCVTGCHAGCTFSGFGPAATFTCNTCSDPRGCP
jgi:hypothetical protein